MNLLSHDFSYLQTIEISFTILILLYVLLQGMILLWDVDSGLAQIDKYFHSNDNHVIAGALLGVGIVNCSIKNDCDPVSRILLFAQYVIYLFGLHVGSYLIPFQAMALLGDYTDKEDTSTRIGAIMGLGIAYAGSQNEQVSRFFNFFESCSRLSDTCGFLFSNVNCVV